MIGTCAVLACGGDATRWLFPTEQAIDCGEGDAVASAALGCEDARAWRRWAEAKAGVDLAPCTIEWVDGAVFAAAGAPDVGGLTTLDSGCRIAVLSAAPNLLAHEALHVRLGANHCRWRAAAVLALHVDAGVVGGYVDGCPSPPVRCAGNGRGWSCRPE